MPSSCEVSVAEVVDFARHMNQVITSKEALEDGWIHQRNSIPLALKMNRNQRCVS
jgi:hypothetical protein